MGLFHRYRDVIVRRTAFKRNALERAISLSRWAISPLKHTPPQKEQAEEAHAARDNRRHEVGFIRWGLLRLRLPRALYESMEGTDEKELMSAIFETLFSCSQSAILHPKTYHVLHRHIISVPTCHLARTTPRLAVPQLFLPAQQQNPPKYGTANPHQTPRALRHAHKTPTVPNSPPSLPGRPSALHLPSGSQPSTTQLASIGSPFGLGAGDDAVSLSVRHVLAHSHRASCDANVPESVAKDTETKAGRWWQQALYVGTSFWVPCGLALRRVGVGMGVYSDGTSGFCQEGLCGEGLRVDGTYPGLRD